MSPTLLILSMLHLNEIYTAMWNHICHGVFNAGAIKILPS